MTSPSSSTTTVASPSRVPVVFRVLVSLALGAGVIALVHSRQLTGPQELPLVGGFWLGVMLAHSAASAAVAVFGRRFGIRAGAVAFGLGPATRTVFGERWIVIVRWIPLPLVRVQAAGAESAAGVRLGPLLGIVFAPARI